MPARSEPTPVDVRLWRDLHELSEQAAALFAQILVAAASKNGRVSFAIAGGATPKPLFSLLASDRYRPLLPWDKIHFFWGDERAVPPDHPDSNYRMARETLLAEVPVPVQNIHRVLAEKGAQIAAAEYERTLKNFFQLAEGELPRFDLIQLGLGEDAHTASLFPETAALNESKRLVVANYVGKLRTWRVTFTFPVLNHAARIVFLVSGAEKAAALHNVLQGEHQPEKLPAQGVRPQSGSLIWMVDQAAASQLKPAMSNKP